MRSVPFVGTAGLSTWVYFFAPGIIAAHAQQGHRIGGEQQAGAFNTTSASTVDPDDRRPLPSDILILHLEGEDEPVTIDVTEYLRNRIAHGMRITKKNVAFANHTGWFAEYTRYAKPRYDASGNTKVIDFFLDDIGIRDELGCLSQPEGCESRSPAILSSLLERFPDDLERARRSLFMIHHIDYFYKRVVADIEMAKRFRKIVKHSICPELAADFFATIYKRSWKAKAACIFIQIILVVIAAAVVLTFPIDPIGVTALVTFSVTYATKLTEGLGISGVGLGDIIALFTYSVEGWSVKDPESRAWIDHKYDITEKDKHLRLASRADTPNDASGKALAAAEAIKRTLAEMVQNGVDFEFTFAHLMDLEDDIEQGVASENDHLVWKFFEQVNEQRHWSLVADAEDAGKHGMISSKLDRRSSSNTLSSAASAAILRHLSSFALKGGYRSTNKEFDAAIALNEPLADLSLSKLTLSADALDALYVQDTQSGKKKFIIDGVTKAEFRSRDPTKLEDLDISRQDIANRAAFIDTALKDNNIVDEAPGSTPTVHVKEVSSPMQMDRQMMSEDPGVALKHSFKLDVSSPTNANLFTRDLQRRDAAERIVRKKNRIMDRTANTIAHGLWRKVAGFQQDDDETAVTKRTPSGEDDDGTDYGPPPVPKGDGKYELDFSKAWFRNKLRRKSLCELHDYHVDNSAENTASCIDHMMPLIRNFIERRNGSIHEDNWKEGHISHFAQQVLDQVAAPKTEKPKTYQEIQVPDRKPNTTQVSTQNLTAAEDLDRRLLSITRNTKTMLVSVAWANQQCWERCIYKGILHVDYRTTFCNKGCWNFPMKKLGRLPGINKWGINSSTVASDSRWLYDKYGTDTLLRKWDLDLANPPPSTGVRPILSVCMQPDVPYLFSDIGPRIPCVCGNQFGSESVAFYQSISWRDTADRPEGLIRSCAEDLAESNMGRDHPAAWTANICRLYFGYVKFSRSRRTSTPF